VDLGKDKRATALILTIGFTMLVGGIIAQLGSAALNRFFILPIGTGVYLGLLNVLTNQRIHRLSVRIIVSLILMPLFSLITWMLVEALGLSWTSKQHALVSAVPVVLLFGPIYRLITVPRDSTG
jgi:hypothetical protein